MYVATKITAGNNNNNSRSADIYIFSVPTKILMRTTSA